MLGSILIAISITLMYSAPLALAAIGGVISERSGIVNIGLEGMMSIGALTGAAVGYFTHNPWIGLLCAGLSGNSNASAIYAHRNCSGVFRRNAGYAVCRA